MASQATVQQALRACSEFGAQTGVRMTWSTIPADGAHARELAVPPAAIYAPLQPIAGMPRLPKVPFRCPGCGAVLNPFCGFAAESEFFTCPLCLRSQPRPAALAAGGTRSPGAFPELAEQHRTVEYVLKDHAGAHAAAPGAARAPVRLFFLIDACCPAKELAACKEGILAAVAALPEAAEIGLGVVGTVTQLMELGEHRAFMYDGATELGDKELAAVLGQNFARRFVKPVGTHLFAFTEALEAVQPDPWGVPKGHRPRRCFGFAMSLAARVLGAGHLLMFLTGPPTAGPGLVTWNLMSEPIRGWDDIASGNACARYHRAAAAYYRATAAHFLDVEGGAARGEFARSVTPFFFVCSPEQVGLLEMRGLAESVGGEILVCESYTQPAYAETLRLFVDALAPAQGGARRVAFGQSCLCEAQPSPGLRVCAMLGQGRALKPTNPEFVGENRLGRGGTHRWALAGSDSVTAFAFILEPHTPKGSAAPEGARRFLQLRFTYFDPAAEKTVLRVTTVPVLTVRAPRPPLTAFDQEAATVLVTRIAVVRGDSGAAPSDVTRTLDTALVGLCRAFGSYTPGDETSFTIHPAFQLFPPFVFHLRRNPAVTLRGEAPDQAAFRRFGLLKRPVAETLRLIQSPLFAYSAGHPAPVPAALDASSIKADRVLLLDTFDRVVVWYGSTVAKWRDSGWADRDGYENVRALLDRPRADAGRITITRFPAPHLTVCDQNGSQARFLLSRLNPSSSYSAPAADQAAILTDDISLLAFISSLKRVVTAAARE